MERPDLICIGMTLIDSIIKGFDPEPVSASGYRAETGSLCVGGEALNEAVAAAKLGMKTGILCSVGMDAAGEMIIAELERNGVDTGRILRSGERQTPVTTMFVNDDGTRKSVTNTAHRFNFRPDLHTGLFTDARAVILGSLFRAPFDDPEIIYSVVKAANAAGQLVVADTKLPNFRILSLQDIKDSLPMIDIITPNEDEAKFFSGKEDPEAMADVFLEAGVKNVLIKLGSKGCFFRNSDEKISLPALDVRAVDATGAGDNMVAGFVARLLQGASYADALRFANACGAICTTAVGAGTALKDREQVEKLLESTGGTQVTPKRRSG